MGEGHLNFFPFVAGAFKGGCFSQGTDMLTDIFIHITWNLACGRVGTAAVLQRTGAAIMGAGPVAIGIIGINLARALQ